MKKLVVYYSFGGNTREIAKRIARFLNASIAEIRTVKAYPDDVDVLMGLGKRETMSGYMPQIQPIPYDINKYDTVIIGTPVWCSTFAPAMKTFLSSVKWEGKRVYPFTTYDDTVGHIGGDLKKALRGAEIAPVCNIKYDEKVLVTSLLDIKAWVNTIK